MLSFFQCLADRPPDEPRGVERGLARHGDDLAGVRVEHHGGAAVGGRLVVGVRQVDAVVHGVLGGALHLGVDRELQVVAGLRQRAAGHDLLGPPAGVDFDAHRAVDAAQPLVVGVLHARLADHVARLVAAEARLGELVRADLAELPEEVGAERRPAGSRAGSSGAPRRRGRRRCARAGTTRWRGSVSCLIVTKSYCRPRPFVIWLQGTPTWRTISCRRRRASWRARGRGA